MSFVDSLFQFLTKARYYAAQQSFTDGQVVELQANSRGELRVDPYGGGSSWQDTATAAAERAIKTTSGYLFQATFFNPHATKTSYIFLYDSPTRPADGGLPRTIPLKIPPGETRGLVFMRPRQFATGIYWVASVNSASLVFDSAATIMSAAEYS